MRRAPASITTPLSDRSLVLFKALVQHFIQDGQPVGSRTLARDTGLDLSPATIRNIMADLEDLGLLHSPHTSAGRVPTVKGYRLYVDSLLRVSNLNDAEVQRIARELDSGDNLKELVQRTSSMLSEITRLAGVVMVPRSGSQALRQIEFVSLNDNRVLVILVVNDREIQNRIIHTARPYKPAELQQAANYLNSMYGGKDLQTVRSQIVEELKQMKDNVGTLMQTAIEVAQKALDLDNTNAGRAPDFVLSGQTNLMDVAELGDLDKLKKLFETFNRKRDLLHLLEQSVNARGVQIFIGEESGYEVLDNCSVVTSPYEVDGQILGVLGVIGPTRMDYERVISIVDLTAKMLGSALKPLN